MLIRLNNWNKKNMETVTGGSLGSTFCVTQFVVFHSNNLKHILRIFPGGPVVKNPPANAGHMGLIPGLGIFHMPWGS